MTSEVIKYDFRHEKTQTNYAIYFDKFDGGGHIILRYYGQAWTVYFDAPIEGNIEKHLIEMCDGDYLACKLCHYKATKTERVLVKELIDTAIKTLKEAQTNDPRN